MTQSLLKFITHGTTDFVTVNFPFLDGDVPFASTYGVYISQPIRLASATA